MLKLLNLCLNKLKYGLITFHILCSTGDQKNELKNRFSISEQKLDFSCTICRLFHLSLRYFLMN